MKLSALIDCISVLPYCRFVRVEEKPGAMPRPLTSIVSGDPAASEAMIMLPARIPVSDGLNVTRNVLLPEGEILSVVEGN
jgi:hypothetical protein